MHTKKNKNTIEYMFKKDVIWNNLFFFFVWFVVSPFADKNTIKYKASCSFDLPN